MQPNHSSEVYRILSTMESFASTSCSESYPLFGDSSGRQESRPEQMKREKGLSKDRSSFTSHPPALLSALSTWGKASSARDSLK
ncbi:hypothetical protein DTO021C3_2999 [Paecilomyces variotii]|nr:hypothetical protein DTO195F2_3250 [Paecilomyces variotii]KAJ9289548.1 hypothetical protein DTO021C3_2999 [Paecilomyces variotii]KAJ9388906.1 hypothetical protein DTO063F5_2554 [Paecilomyces variotii]